VDVKFGDNFCTHADKVKYSGNDAFDVSNWSFRLLKAISRYFTDRSVIQINTV